MSCFSSYLDLRWNNIGLLGGRALLNCLHSNRALRQLELAGNNVPSDILKAVGEQLCQPFTCLEFYIQLLQQAALYPAVLYKRNKRSTSSLRPKKIFRQAHSPGLGGRAAHLLEFFLVYIMSFSEVTGGHC